MAINISASPRYEKFDPQVLTVGTTEVAFPDATASTGVVKPEAIFVQAYSQNSGRVVIGKTGLAADGTTGVIGELAAGANMTLPVGAISSLYARATAAGQKLFITYLEKVI